MHVECVMYSVNDIAGPSTLNVDPVLKSLSAIKPAIVSSFLGKATGFELYSFLGFRQMIDADSFEHTALVFPSATTHANPVQACPSFRP